MPFLFEGLEVYKKAMQFLVSVYALNGLLRDRNIKDQLRRAAMSIPLNIAEGQGRMHGKEKRQYYNTARGSLLECVPLIQACWKLNYITNEKYNYLYDLANEIGKMTSGLIKSVKTGEIKRT
ncbi:MAG: four helix bundle protein [Candidatus Margulisbacteria bacterium]|nr:four helix bundle protein [Candidatus Margulisiibacteriota bacterium]